MKNKRCCRCSIQEVLDTNTYINGPKVHEFQKSLEEYLDVKHVIPVPMVLMLQIAMMGLISWR
jgi:dTDP-4-amino-4,6-dideoxygalactose transaminase